MEDEPLFLTREQVDKLHRISLDTYGGQDGVRDESGLESAIRAPINDWYYTDADLIDLAAAYAFHISQAQAYIDGNKRTAVVVAFTFLEVNGINTEFESYSFHSDLEKVAAKKMTKQELSGSLRSLIFEDSDSISDE